MLATLSRIEAQPESYLLTAEEEQILGTLLHSDDAAIAARARAAFTRHNTRLVWRVVERMARTRPHDGMDRNDLFQTGCEGLLYGMDKWQTGRGRFSTYAMFWITQRIRREIDTHCRVVRLPVHIEEKLRTLAWTRSALTTALGRAPTAAEIHTAMGLNATQVALLEQGHAINNQVSLDALLDPGESELRLADAVPDGRADEIWSQIDSAVAASALLAVLPERERLVLTLRYGLDGHDERTLDEIGARLGITRERVRQIQERALAALRRAFPRAREVLV